MQCGQLAQLNSAEESDRFKALQSVEAERLTHQACTDFASSWLEDNQNRAPTWEVARSRHREGAEPRDKLTRTLPPMGHRACPGLPRDARPARPLVTEGEAQLEATQPRASPPWAGRPRGPAGSCPELCLPRPAHGCRRQTSEASVDLARSSQELKRKAAAFTLTCCKTFSVKISWSLEISTTFPSICLHNRTDDM